MQSCVVLLSVLVVIMISFASAGGGGWTQQQNPNSPAIKDVAKWAVIQLNQNLGKTEDSFALVTIVSAQTQVVAGINYKLRVALQSVSGQEAMYDLIVYQNLQLKRTLVSSVEYEE